MPQFLGAPGDLPPAPPPPPSAPLSELEQKRGERGEKGEKLRQGKGNGALSLARLLVSSSSTPSSTSSSSFSSLPRSVGSPSWSRAHALVEELNARAHAEAAEGKEELVPLALAAETETETEEGATRGARRKSPLAAVSAHLLAASAWRAKALPLVLRSLEEEESKKREEKESSSSFLGLYGLLRHDVSCANLLAVALSAPPPAPISTKASAAAAKASPTKNPTTPLSVSVPLPSAIRALCDDSATACALAAWAARSLRWWDAERGGRAAAARTAEAAAKKAATAKAKGKNSSCLSSPSLAADETALAAASSALAVFRCLAQHAEDLPPGVGEVLSGAGAGDLVPVLLSLLDRPPWISKSRGAEGREETLVLGGRGWELQQQEQGQGEGEEEDQEFLFPLQTALSWLSLLFLCLGASFSSSSFSKPSSSFCALKSDLRDWSPNSEGQFLGTRLASLLKKNPIALAAVPPLAGVLLPLAEAAAAGRGSRGGRRGGSGVRGEAAAAAARACCFGGGGLSSFSSSSAPSPLLVEVVSSSSSSNDDDDIEAAIDATDWGEVASSCLRRLLAGKKKESGEEGEGEEEEKEQGGGDENETSSSSSRSPSWAGLGAVVKALEEQPELASFSSASASPSRGGRAGAARARGLVRVCAWAAETPGNDDDGKTSSTSPWSESFELELDPKGSSEEVDLPGCRKGLRRKLRVVAAPLAEEGGGTALVLPPTLPPSGRLVASTFNCSSSASASYRLPSCELSLDIDSLPKSLWVMLGSFEEGDEENESETVNEKSEEEAKLRNSKKFILQLKLRRQTAGRASRRSHYGAWGAYAPCGGAITTLL